MAGNSHPILGSDVAPIITQERITPTRPPHYSSLFLPRCGSHFLPLPRHELHVSADDGVYGAELRGVRLQLQFVHRHELAAWERELENQLAEFRGEGEEGGWGVVVGCRVCGLRAVEGGFGFGGFWSGGGGSGKIALFAFGDFAAARFGGWRIEGCRGDGQLEAFAGAVSGLDHRVGCVGRRGIAVLGCGGFGALRNSSGCVGVV